MGVCLLVPKRHNVRYTANKNYVKFIERSAQNIKNRKRLEKEEKEDRGEKCWIFGEASADNA